VGRRRDRHHGDVKSRIAPLVVALWMLAACGSSGSSSPKLALGTKAEVAYTSPESGDNAAVDTRLAITVLDVREGTQSELVEGGFTIDDDIKDATPYYVDVRYENVGTGDALTNLSVGMEDTKGNSISSTIVLNFGGEPFSHCPDDETKPLPAGKSYEECTLFLVPKGKKIERVRFVSQAPDAKITFTDWALE
jgi:hypothetical protein